MMSNWTDSEQIFGIEEKQKYSSTNSLTEETCPTSREHRKRIGQRWHCKFAQSEMDKSVRDTNHPTKLSNQNLRRDGWSGLETLNFCPPPRLHQRKRTWTILDEDSLDCSKSGWPLIRSVEVLELVSFGTLTELEFFMRREHIFGLKFESSSTDLLFFGMRLTMTVNISRWYRIHITRTQELRQQSYMSHAKSYPQSTYRDTSRRYVTNCESVIYNSSIIIIWKMLNASLWKIISISILISDDR